MKIQILSDLHLEFGDWTPPKVNADVTILAGDISVKARGVDWAIKNFDNPIVYIPGNHEFYGGSLGHTLDKMREKAAGTNVHILQGEVFNFAGIQFVGATLWTNYRLTGNMPLAMFDAGQRLNDFRKIRSETFSRISPRYIAIKHAEHRQKIEAAIANKVKTVVISHHAPTSLSISSHHGLSHLDASYASNLDHMMLDNVALWVHGHTHENFDYRIDQTRVICNPRGYSMELNPGFIQDLVVEI